MARRILVTAAGLLAITVLCSCAGVQQGFPQTQAADNYGPQQPQITYHVTTTAGDSSIVIVTVGESTQDASQQGASEQGQTGGTAGPVDNKPNIAPSLSVPIP
jgi:hypothetical protein